MPSIAVAFPLLPGKAVEARRFAAEDPAQAFREYAASDAPIDAWSKQRVQALTGVDMNQPPPGPLRMPGVLLGGGADLALLQQLLAGALDLPLVATLQVGE
jgi:hypothetical protein